MIHKIAIIKGREISHYLDDYQDTIVRIAETITEWTEVSAEEYKILKDASDTLGFSIIEQPTDTPAFIAKTVKDYIKLAEESAKREAEEKKKRAEAALQRKLKKQLKDKESKKELLERLKKELGEA